MKKFLFLIAVFCFVFSNIAAADVLCIKNAAKPNKKGKVILKKVLKTETSTCPKGYTQVLDTSVFTGPQGAKGDKGDTGATGATGAQGPAGADGKVDLSTCVTETILFGTCNAGNACDLQLACGDANTSNGSEVGDYMIQWGWNSNTNSAYMTRSELLIAAGGLYPTGASITTTSEDGFVSHSPALSIICCLPN